MDTIKSKTLNQLADILFLDIKSKKDPFNTTTIVCPNILMQQWLKAYWLKAENESVLMNVSFKTIDDILPLLVEQQNYRLIRINALKQIVLRILSDDDCLIIPQELKKYYQNNPIKLYDFASTLASLLLDYYKDDFKNINGFQNDLYDEVVEICGKYNYGTIERPVPYKGKRDTIYFFGFSKLDKVYENLLLACDFAKMFSLELDENCETPYSIAMAPSMVREIEYVHSDICKLLNSGARVSDFLIVGPDMASYRNTIERVFRQNDEEYPSIPYVISCHGTSNDDAVSVLKLLFKAIKNGYFTRLDFYQLVTNPIVRQVRGISIDEIDNWMETIINLNIYRKHDYLNDWAYLKKRLVLSKVSSVNFTHDNVVSLKDDDYLPYTNIGFDDDSILRIISVIDDINTFMSLLKDKDAINSNDIDAIKTELDKWLSFSDGEVETNLLYKKILTSIEIVKDINGDNISSDVFFYTLFADGLVNTFQKGNGFSQGITFVDLNINSIYSAKYVYFINASSKNTPLPVIKSELDQRNYVKENDDVSAFLLLRQNAHEHFSISYVYEDLKTEEEFYLAPYIVEMDKRQNKIIENKKYIRIDLDETRDYSELFTRKEFNDKKYYNQLLNGEFIQSESKKMREEDFVEPILKETLTVSDIANFLEEPLSYKATKLFNRVDEKPKKIRKEWEPFSIDALTNGTLIKKILFRMLNNNFDYEKTYEELKRNNLISTVNEEYEKGLFRQLVEDSKFNFDLINEESLGNYIIIEPHTLKMTKKITVDCEEKNLEWMLISSSYMCLFVEGSKRTYYEVIDLFSRPKEHKFLKVYIMALMDIACLDEEEYEVVLKRYRTSRTFTVTPSRANEILNTIHGVITDYSHNAVAPIDLDKIPETYSSLIKALLDEHGLWTNFDHSKMFDYENGLGYDSNNYKKKDFIVEMNKQKSMIEYFEQIEEENENG